MKKTVIIIAVALITLSATLAFRTKSEIISVKEEKVATTNNGGGFALQDQDQWK
jgi:hypothetical protein